MTEVQTYLEKYMPYTPNKALDEIVLKSDYPFDTRRRNEQNLLAWSSSIQTMNQFFCECPNVVWLMMLFSRIQGGYPKTWRKIACSSIREEVWPFLYINKEGIIGGQIDEEDKPKLKQIGNSGWHVPTEERELIWKIERYAEPWTCFIGEIIEEKDIVGKMKYFFEPFWNVYNLAMNACYLMTNYNPFYACWISLDYIQKAIGLLSVINFLGKVPKKDEEVVWLQVEGGPKVYEEAVKGCQLRQANLVRKYIGNPWKYSQK
jgi:hypothetical protein